jgi:hypothetical protein
LRKITVGGISIRKRFSVVFSSKPRCLLKENRWWRPGIEPAPHIDYIIRQHYDPDTAVSNRLYTARYELSSYRVSVYERLEYTHVLILCFCLRYDTVGEPQRECREQGAGEEEQRE